MTIFKIIFNKIKINLKQSLHLKNVKKQKYFFKKLIFNQFRNLNFLNHNLNHICFYIPLIFYHIFHKVAKLHKYTYYSFHNATLAIYHISYKSYSANNSYLALHHQNKNCNNMGIGDWGLGIGDWAQSPIPNPQSPIPKKTYFLLSSSKNI
jgi:hypothetical protein